MQEAYTYRVIKASKNYLIYTDEIFLGSFPKKSWRRQLGVIKIKEHQYRLEASGIINPTIIITNTTTKELLGHVKISNFATLFPKAVFKYNNTTLKWVTKSIFSLHWQWKKADVAIIETIEKFGEQTGIIALSDYFVDADLLIMLGVYLRYNIKILSVRRVGFVKKDTKKFKPLLYI
jgi:hypothetical protein